MCTHCSKLQEHKGQNSCPVLMYLIQSDSETDNKQNDE